MNFLKEILLRDVEDENESGRAAYILRVAALALCAYFLIFGVLLLFFRFMLPSLLPFVFILAFGGILVFTYHNHTHRSLNYFYASGILWIIAAVVMFGWDCGIQHLSFVLLLLVFTTSYHSTKIKVLQSLCIYALRMGLYYYTLYNPPFYPLGKQLNSILQIVDTSTVYILLILIMTVFAGDTLRAEGKLAKANRKLNTLAGTDPLTKLPNRRHAIELIQDAVEESQGCIAPTIAIGDIDFFKKVNDTYGHEAGDRVLTVLAELFQTTMAPYGFCARWGGEEFLFFFPHLNLDNAYTTLYDLLAKIRVTVIPFGDKQISVTMTFGMEDGLLRSDDSSHLTYQIDEIIKKADEKLYLGKTSGRNKVVA